MQKGSYRILEGYKANSSSSMAKEYEISKELKDLCGGVKRCGKEQERKKRGGRRRDREKVQKRRKGRGGGGGCISV